MIKSIGSVPIALRTPKPETAGPEKTPSGAPSFEQTLKTFIQETNQMQQDANTAARQLVAGQTNDIHQVMILGEKASIAFELLLEARNRLMDGYQEMMRMQV
jgi:flagellar hook-basal body complex protein FliE